MLTRVPFLVRATVLFCTVLQVVHNVTMGIVKAVEMQATDPILDHTRTTDVESHSFTDYRPSVFKRLREMQNISEAHYIAQIKLPTKVCASHSWRVMGW